MKRFGVWVFIVAALLLTGCVGRRVTQQEIAQQDRVVELTFTFTRQSGFSTNQFAVWIEDTQGSYVKTLYATRFTANGGYKRRPSSISTWVRRSELANMSRAQTDALSGATPRTGMLTYHWDGTADTGASVPIGEYVLFLEGTLRGENQVVYRSPILFGYGAASAEVSVEYTGVDATAERSMISNVNVKVLQ